jgi:hypothetical protein
VDEQAEQGDRGTGGPGSGPQTGVGGRSQDSSSGVSPQEAAENLNPGGAGSAPPSADDAGD